MMIIESGQRLNTPATNRRGIKIITSHRRMPVSRNESLDSGAPLDFGRRNDEFRNKLREIEPQEVKQENLDKMIPEKLFPPAATRGRASFSAGQHAASAKGFSLIELMVVVLIIGIIAAFAYPAYQDTVRKSRRADALAALGDAASRMEQLYLDRKSYSDSTTNMMSIGFATNPAASQEGYYTIEISQVTPGGCAATNSCSGYELTATVTTKGGQDADSACETITINNQGQKLPKACW